MQLNYWGSGVGQNGIANGPSSAPSLAAASTANIYQDLVRNPAGACSRSAPNQYPSVYVDGLAQNYWVDMEVTLASGAPVNGPPVNSGAFLSFFA